MTHRLPVRVYWEDTDAGGIVYHARYLHFLERARTEWLRQKGVGQSAFLAQTGIAFTVRRMELDFRRPARLDDELVVLTTLREMRGASLTLDQEIRRGDEPMVAAVVEIAAVQVSAGKPARIPAALRQLIGP